MKKVNIIILAAIILFSCGKNITTSSSSKTKGQPAVSTFKNSAVTAKLLEKEKVVTNPNINEPTLSVTSKPVVNLFVETKKENAMVDEGKVIYTAKCGKCHDLKDPQTYDAPKWVKIVDWMAPKAKLNATEKENVLAYVSFNAKK